MTSNLLPTTLRSLRTSTTNKLKNSTSTRSSFLHTRVPLPYEIEAGLKPFLSKKALRVVAQDWQEGVLDRLNVLVRGTECEGMSALQTLKQTASDSTRSTTFNYASEALNNSFFLSTLSPIPIPLNPTSQLSQSITRSFSSFESFQSKFSSHISGLHPSSGAYVWLVTDVSGNLGIVGTYAGGTVLVYQRLQMGNVPTMGSVLGEKILVKTKLETEELVEDGQGGVVKVKKSGTGKFTTLPAGTQTNNSSLEALDRGIRFGGASDPSSRKPIHPLMCLSVHPHCYLGDFGVWGRQEYVEKWWEVIDWTKISASYDLITSKGKAV